MVVKKIINDRQRTRKVYGFVRRLPDLVTQQVESDASVLALDWKESVRCASVGDINISIAPPVTIDGITLAQNDRVLLKDQATAYENGIYTIDLVGGAFVRALDSIPGTTLTTGATTYVEEGTTNVGTKWLLATTNITPVTLQTWVLFDAGSVWQTNGSEIKTIYPTSIGANYPSTIATDIFFYVNGTPGGTDRSLFEGDTVVSGTLYSGNGILPVDDALQNLGSETKRWANVYTGDLHLRNDRGDWTIIEEHEHLTVRNNTTNKVYKIVMEPIEGNK